MHARKNSKKRLTFEALESRTLLSLTYPIDPGLVKVEDNGTLTANYISVEHMNIASGSTVSLTPNSLVEDLSILKVANDGLLNVVGGDKTLGNVSGNGDVNVSGGTLTVSSLNQNTLTIAAGATVVIAPLPGPLGTLLTPKVTHRPTNQIASMIGGTLHYPSDALANIFPSNGAVLINTDPPNLKNAWRSTSVANSTTPIPFPILADDGTVIPRDTDPSTWPAVDPNSVDSQIPVQTKTYKNRFGQTIAIDQENQTKNWNGDVSNETNLLAYDVDRNINYYEGEVSSITPGPDALTVNLANQSLSLLGSAELAALEPIPPVYAGLANSWGITQNVRWGTGIIDQLFGGNNGAPSSGDWSQPAGKGEGSFWQDRNDTYVNVMLLGSNGSSCNTLMPTSGTDTDFNAGRTKVKLVTLIPTLSYTFTWRIVINTYVTKVDPRLKNPRTGIPDGGTTVTISSDLIPPGIIPPAIPTAKTAQNNPMPPGQDPYYVSFDTGLMSSSATADAKGIINLVTITPHMRNSSVGLVGFGAVVIVYAASGGGSGYILEAPAAAPASITTASSPSSFAVVSVPAPTTIATNSTGTTSTFDGYNLPSKMPARVENSHQELKPFYFRAMQEIRNSEIDRKDDLFKLIDFDTWLQDLSLSNILQEVRL